jgi:uncharacterized protein (UPF0335 family)
VVARTPKKDAPEPKAADYLSNSAGLLFSFVERLERLAEEKQALADDMKEVFGEAKSSGFDTKALRTAIARRKMDSASRQEMDALLELYEDTIEEAEKKAFSDSVAAGGA